MPHDSSAQLPPKAPQSRLEAALHHYGERAAFSPLFAERIERRINTELAATHGKHVLSPFDALTQELVWMFRRFAIIGMSVAVLLAGYNMYANGDISLDAVFGLPDETHGLSVESILMPD